VTLNVSQTGLYFLTSETQYTVGLKVQIEYPPASKNSARQGPRTGAIARIAQLGENTLGVAVHLDE